MAVAQLLLSMEPKYICHKLCTMGTSSPMVPILSTEIFPIPAITKSYGEFPLNENNNPEEKKTSLKLRVGPDPKSCFKSPESLILGWGRSS